MKGQVNLLDEIIIDNFAGGGGASTGIELATGRPVTIAINHDPAAILMHKTNHPYTVHMQASVWDVDPVAVCAGRPVGLAWFSADPMAGENACAGRSSRHDSGEVQAMEIGRGDHRLDSADVFRI